MSAGGILYSFRRCPYAIRARLALAGAGVAVEVREVAAKRGKMKSLYALADLKLDAGAVHVERRISVDEFVSHAFLDNWVVGDVREAAEEDVGGAVVVGAILTLNHKPGRYLGV